MFNKEFLSLEKGFALGAADDGMFNERISAVMGTIHIAIVRKKKVINFIYKNKYVLGTDYFVSNICLTARQPMYVAHCCFIYIRLEKASQTSRGSWWHFRLFKIL